MNDNIKKFNKTIHKIEQIYKKYILLKSPVNTVLRFVTKENKKGNFSK